jgi:hypothetical protein
MGREFGYTPDQVDSLDAGIADGLMIISKAISEKQETEREMQKSKARAKRK